MLDTVADYIKTRHDLDTSRVAVYGWSMGAIWELLAGCETTSTKRLSM
jgi:dienelactone hydrolase